MSTRTPAMSICNADVSSSVLCRRKKSARRSERRRISEEGLGVWTKVEHSRFLEGKRLYPNGPWKLVAEYVGTRNTRQTMTHAQKYRQKLERRQRGLRTTRKISHDESEMASSPEMYYTSSPLFEQASSSPKGVDMSSPSPLSKIKVVDVSTINTTLVADKRSQSFTTTLKFGSFEQLLMDDTILLDDDAALEGYRSELPKVDPLKHAVESSSPTHHADADLPWLDECLDFFIHNLP